jgi:hypothetical protein
MPLDVLGRTRATLINPTSPLQSRRDVVGAGQTVSIIVAVLDRAWADRSG